MKTIRSVSHQLGSYNHYPFLMIKDISMMMPKHVVRMVIIKFKRLLYFFHIYPYPHNGEDITIYLKLNQWPVKRPKISSKYIMK